MDGTTGVQALNVTVYLNGYTVCKGITNTNGKYVCFSKLSNDRQEFTFTG